MGGQTAAPEQAGENGEKAEAEKPAPRLILTEGQAAALRRLLADRTQKYDRLVVNIPRAWTTSRLFHFPTKDRKTIQSSLAFELDDDIPFPMSEVVYDCAVLTSEGTTSTV